MIFAPSVRILSLLVLATGLASGHPRVLVAGAVILLLAGALALKHHAEVEWSGLMRMLRRVRWLLLAMLILYGWFTPGAALLPSLGDWSPSLVGLQQGLLRVAALLAIVIAVYLLLVTTPRGDLVGGLLWFGRPLRRLGVDDHRFAVRLVLALEAVPQVQGLARAALETDAGASRLQRLNQASSRVLQAVLERAEAQHGDIQVPDAQPVPGWQWLLPVLTALLLVIVAAV
ncbi:MAG: energy-coupling factor transporter transmembrane protein EcfT [Gammaproteobacteria bacterium]|nr:energy-coupling factor transporter transmembrane protein EcfT [Gammaproteobacteria bacterium]